MKKYTSFLLVLVLTFALFTGCGCRNSQPAPTSQPTTVPTTAPTTAPTTPSSIATTQATEPSMNETIEDGNGPMPTGETGTGEARGFRNGNINGDNGGLIGNNGTGVGPMG